MEICPARKTSISGSPATALTTNSPDDRLVLRSICTVNGSGRPRIIDGGTDLDCMGRDRSCSSRDKRGCR